MLGLLNLHDIQGNILRGYNFGAGSHYFVSVRDGMTGRALLRTLLPEITTARTWSTPPVIALNVALTYAGLVKLDVDEAILDLLPPAFREPIRHRARIVLGDNPCEWDDVFGNQETDLLVLLATSEQPQKDDTFEWRFPKLRRACRWLDDRLRDYEARCVHRQDVEALLGKEGQRNPREHFGFADGFGQPAVEGMSNNWPGQGIPEPPETGAWRDIKAGEFVLGYPNEDDESLPKEATWLLYDGSFMVYRKLEQHVREFHEIVAEQAERYLQTELDARRLDERLNRDDAKEWLLAKLVGRWRDGTALELHHGPNRDRDPCISGHVENNFRYAHDPGGRHCPVGAHIRRANPRDLLGSDQESGRHRIIRRGMPYGPPYDDSGEGHDEAAADGGAPERGLIFICFNGDFERQFEVVQGQWLNDGNAFGLGEHQDYLIGSRQDATFTVDGKPPFFVTRERRLVTTRGCEYLFMPGLAALERLSAPRSPVTQLEKIPPREPGAIHQVVGLVTEQMGCSYASLRPMLRGQHPKSHACVEAKFIVVEDVPEDLRVGLFRQTRPYDAWIRFSASHAGPQSDAKPDAQGIAIKVLEVDGEKILPRERWCKTQDFILVNHEVFFLTNAKAVARFARVVTATGCVRGLDIQSKFRLLEFFLARNGRGAGILWQMLSTKPDNPLDVTYWSETAYALGDRAVKYMVRPTEQVGPQGARPSDWDALEDAMKTALEERGAPYSLDFLVQVQSDEHTMPVENPLVAWSDTESEFRKVATIRIGDQHFTSQNRRNFGENLIFTPWHSRWEHRPLGGINRLRRWVYEASSDLRHDLNNAAFCEPGGTIEPHPPRMPV
jgi:Dyp-type peroxidase family